MICAYPYRPADLLSVRTALACAPPHAEARLPCAGGCALSACTYAEAVLPLRRRDRPLRQVRARRQARAAAGDAAAVARREVDGRGPEDVERRGARVARAADRCAPCLLPGGQPPPHPTTVLYAAAFPLAGASSRRACTYSSTWQLRRVPRACSLADVPPAAWPADDGERMEMLKALMDMEECRVSTIFCHVYGHCVDGTPPTQWDPTHACPKGPHITSVGPHPR